MADQATTRASTSKAVGRAAGSYNLLIAHRAWDPTLSNLEITRAFDTLGEWLPIEESIYVLWTSEPPGKVQAKIREAAGANDAVAVIDLAERFGADWNAILGADNGAGAAATPRARLVRDRVMAGMAAAA
jgi:hypothetical protein